MDESTKKYLIDAAEKRCTCDNCMREKAEKAFKASLELPNKMFQNPRGFTTELSSDASSWKKKSEN